MRCAYPRASCEIVLDVNSLSSEIDRTNAPDLEVIGPFVVLMRREQRDVLAELEDRGARLRHGNTIGKKGDLVAILGSDLGMNVEVETTIRAASKEICALDCAGDPGPGRRPLKRDVEA